MHINNCIYNIKWLITSRRVVYCCPHGNPTWGEAGEPEAIQAELVFGGSSQPIPPTWLSVVAGELRTLPGTPFIDTTHLALRRNTLGMSVERQVINNFELSQLLNSCCVFIYGSARKVLGPCQILELWKVGPQRQEHIWAPHTRSKTIAILGMTHHQVSFLIHIQLIDRQCLNWPLETIMYNDAIKQYMHCWGLRGLAIRWKV